MRLLLGISEGGDVIVDLDGDLTVGDLARALATSSGWPARAADQTNLSLSVDRTGWTLDPSAPVGQVDLRSGDLVDIVLVKPGDSVFTLPDEGEPEASLRVLSGPLEGSVFQLSFPACTIGRSADNDVVLLDPSVSRKHATFVIEPAGVTVTDLGSTNGIHIDGRPAVGPTPVPAGKRILIGRSWALVEHSAGPLRPVNGRIVVESTAMPVPFIAPTIEVPAPPAKSAASRILGMGGRNGNVSVPADYQTVLDASIAKLEAAHGRERTALLDSSPSFAAVAEGVRSRSRLWERRLVDPDGLSVRLGLAELEAQTKVVIGEGGNEALRSYAERIPRRFQNIDGVPVTVDLGKTGGVVLDGSVASTHPLAASLAGQLVGLKKPDDLGVLLLGWPADGPSTWDWMKWIPHADLDGSGIPTVGADSAAILGELLAGATTISGRTDTAKERPPVVVVIVDGDPPPEHSELFEQLVVEGRNRGLFTMVLTGPNGKSLPTAAGAWPLVAVNDRLAQLVTPFEPVIEPIALETCTRHECRSLGRALAGLRVAGTVDSDAHGPSAVVEGQIVVRTLLFGRPAAERFGDFSSFQTGVDVSALAPPTGTPTPGDRPAEILPLAISATDSEPGTQAVDGSATGGGLDEIDVRAEPATDAIDVRADSGGLDHIDVRGEDGEMGGRDQPGAGQGHNGHDQLAGAPNVDAGVGLAEPGDDGGSESQATSGKVPAGISIAPATANTVALRNSGGPLLPDEKALGVAPVPPAVLPTGPDGSSIPNISAPTDSRAETGGGQRLPSATSSGASSRVAPRLARPVFVDMDDLPRSGDAFRLVLGIVIGDGKSKSASFAFNPSRDGSLALVGAEGSGKSTCLRSIAAATVRVDRPLSSLPLLYQLDVSTELAPIAALPTARGATEDTDAIIAVLAELESLLDERIALKGGFDPGSRPVVVLVDEVHAMLRHMEPVAPGRLRGVLGRLLKEGPSHGIHAVLSVGSAADLDPWLASYLGRWIPLDPEEPGVGTIGSIKVRFAALSGEFDGTLDESFARLAAELGPGHAGDQTISP